MGKSRVFLLILFFATSAQAMSRSHKVAPTDEPTDQDCAESKTAVWTPPAEFEWTFNLDGQPSDLVNFYVHGSIETLTDAFTKAGWNEAAPRNTKDAFKYLGAIALDFRFFPRMQHVVQTMPVSTLTRCGLPPSVAFESDNHPLGGRNHFRIFDTGRSDADGLHVWAIAATLDSGLTFDPKDPQTGFLTHAIEKDQDHERELVMKSLNDSGEVADLRLLDPTSVDPSPVTGAYSSDGVVYDVTMKASPQ